MKRFMLWVGIAATFAVVGCKKSVPKVEGLDEKSASLKLEDSGFKVGSVSKTFTGSCDSRTVVSQNPAAATKLRKGSVVDLTVEESVALPSLLGLELRTALQAAGAQGLRVSVKTKPTKDAPAGTVLDQSPLPGRVATGTPVEVVVAGEEKILQTLLGSGTIEGIREMVIGGVTNKLSHEINHAFEDAHAKPKEKDKNKDAPRKDRKENGIGKVVGDEFDKQTDKSIDKGVDNNFGKDVAKDLGDEFDKEIDKTIDKAIDKGVDKNFGKDIAKDAGKEFAKGASHKAIEWLKSRKDSAKGGDKKEADSFEALGAPAQLSPHPGENVNTVANRVNFAWGQVAGAASYTVEVETLAGKNWIKLGTRSGLVETRFSATITAPNARWRVRAVDTQQKDGHVSGWAQFALVRSGENVSTPVK